MHSSLDNAREVVQAALHDLTEIVMRARMGGSPERMMTDLKRWKRRISEDFRTHVSPRESVEFDRISIQPSWVNMETIDAPLQRHVAFLDALLEEIDRRPGRTVATTPSSGRELPGKPVVFLSHSAADAALAEWLEAAIRGSIANTEVFRTTRLGQIPSGLAWFQHIGEHLRGATKYIVLITPASQNRPWVNFEVGAAWMSGRKLVPVLGGGLSAGSTVEPLKNLQLLSLEDPAQAAQAIQELGGQLQDPAGFSARCRELGLVGRETALRMAGWSQIEFEGQMYAWAGPLEDCKESHGVPLPEGLPKLLQDSGLRPATGIPGDLWNEYSKGYQQVWLIDERLYKHPVVSRDKQVLLVKPAA